MKGNTKRKKIINSKNKDKKTKKRESFINLKKIQNEQRQKVIESLMKHNQSDNTLLSSLQSSKNLGLKRKPKSPLKHPKEKEQEKEDEEVNEVPHEEVDESMSISSSEEIQVNNDKSQNPPKPNAPTLSVIDKEEILKKIHEQHQAELLLEQAEEEKDIIFDENFLFKPPESSLVFPNRTEEIKAFRQSLPIINQEHDIMYAIDNSLITIISGETGSGKSTQIPQFIYEKGYTATIGKIVITQPRRVAARALAMRLAEELNYKIGNEVGYQIRYETTNCKESTQIKFVTDGILLNEIKNDYLLSKYSVIIIDEAHERTINSDLIIGFVSRILRLRYALWRKGTKFSDGSNVYPLRLVIMSATLKVEEFKDSQVFSGMTARVVEVAAKKFKVSIYHSKKTKEDYLSEAFRISCKIHRKLPEGNVLIFLTGKREILELCEKLRKEFSGGKEGTDIKQKEPIQEPKKEGTEETAEEKIIDEDDNPEENHEPYKPVIILPLYSSMSPEDQMKIYENHQNKRMIVVATNVAETSLTIPNIRYVIDSGKVKKRIYKSGLSFSSFEIEWISKASADQRSGRAGRQCDGFCYRLYSNGLYVKMDDFTEPQISSSPLPQVILTLKSMGVKNIHDFPFITKPNSFFIDKAVSHLVVIGALNANNNTNEERLVMIKKILSMGDENSELFSKDDSTITETGKLMSKFPIEPKLAKMLIMANSFNVLEYVVVIVGILSVENPFDLSCSYSSLRDELKELSIYNNMSDIITYMNLVILKLLNKKLCKEKEDSVIKISKRKSDEMTNIINQIFGLCENIFKKKLNPLSTLAPLKENDQGILLQISLCAFIDNIARKKVIYDEVGNKVEEKSSQVLSKKTIYECNENNYECKLHHLSVLNDTQPNYVIYKEIINDSKASLMMVSAIKPEWLYNIGGALVKAKLATNVKEPFYNKSNDIVYAFVDIVYGYKQWDISNVAVEMKKDENYYRYFAKMLLDGDIIEKFKYYKQYLNSKSSIITNKISDGYAKVNRLVKELMNNKIDNKEKLLKATKENNSFLKETIVMWYDKEKIRSEIRLKWPFS